MEYNQENTWLIYIYALLLPFLLYFMPSFLFGFSALVLVLISTIYKHKKGGIISAIYSSILLISFSIYQNYPLYKIVDDLFLIILIVFGLTKTLAIIKEKNNKLEEYDKKEKEFFRAIVFSIIKILELHDEYTKGHSKNVAKLSKEIALKMDLSKKKVNDVYWTGILHDIGKILVKEEILNKRMKLKDWEFEEIKKHPIYGHKILTQSEALQEIAEYVLYHHENYNGSGYPNRLEGKEIPLVSRIITVADAWDAMTSDRPYRQALNKDIALERIEENKEIQFDPEIVEVFKKIIKEEYPYLSFFKKDK